LWREEFDGNDTAGRVFSPGLHVQLIAHPGRLAMLDRFTSVAVRARFMTCGEVAATVG
jgi:hypothetical protein